MTTTSRRLAAKSKDSKPSHTAGKTKGGNCVKSPLKTWGATANPYKLKGGQAQLFVVYSAEVRKLNK